MNTTPPPLEIFRIETYSDNRGRIIVARYQVPVSADAAVLIGVLGGANPHSFIGQGIAGVMTPEGPQQVPFEIPLTGPTIQDAFAQFDAQQEPAFRAHLEKMRMAALKQGADLSQLPRAQEHRKR